jgi:plasmid stabilization system protein ParE
MAKVIWSPSALDDIESIAQYIARDSADAASMVVHRIIEAVDILEQSPQAGRVIPEINNLLCRELIFGVYRCMYRIENDEVWITGIIHGSTNWKPE